MVDYDKNREMILERAREYYYKNQEILKQKARERAAKNRDKINAYFKEYYAKIKALNDLPPPKQRQKKRKSTLSSMPSYYDLHKDIINRRSKEYYRNHAEELKKMQRDIYYPIRKQREQLKRQKELQKYLEKEKKKRTYKRLKDIKVVKKAPPIPEETPVLKPKNLRVYLW